MWLVNIGLSHRDAALELREEVAVSPGDMVPVRAAFAAEAEAGEVVVLSTCNRTEVYLAAVGDRVDETSLSNAFADICGVDTERLEGKLVMRRDEGAARHLFRVASGLEAMIVGETQILGQTRDAYDDARRAGSTGPLLNKLFQGAIAAAKRTHGETGIGEGAVSVPYAAAELSRKIFGDLGASTVLVIGAGETGRLAALHLNEAGAGRFLVANRSPERADEVATEVGGDPLPLAAVADELHRADIVVGCAHVDEPLISGAMVRAAMSRRGGDPIFFVDLGVPRNISAEVRGKYNVFCYTLDDLAGVVDENIERRQGEAQLAERIIGAELERFRSWRREQAAVPVIRELQQVAEEIRRREVDRHRRRFAETEHEDLDRLTRIIVKRILQAPIIQLKEEVKQERTGLIAGVRELFGLSGRDDE